MAGTGFLLSLIALVVGAVLKFAVNARVEGISIQLVGTIIILAGVIGLIGSLVAWYGEQRDRRTRRVRPAVRETVVEERDPLR